MDERESGVKAARDPKQDPNERADDLARRADAIRGDLDHLVGELDQRAHNAMRRYVKPAAIGAAVLAAGIVALLLWRRHRRPPSRIERLGLALRRAVAHPDRVAKPTPSIAKKVIAAAGAAGASMAARTWVSKALAEANKAYAGR
jgi:hypothetical protein